MKKKLSLRATIKQHTEIEIEPGILSKDSFCKNIKALEKRVVIITHTNLKNGLGSSLLNHLTSFGIETWLMDFESGEKAKSIETVIELQHKMMELQLGKDTVILALGGGIVSDVAGFVASTFNRGVPLILIPTSFLAMVDACIGGKTGVNTKFGKNLIGSFYMPIKIFSDPELLNSLPDKEWTNGLAEVVKYGVSLDSEVFKILEDGLGKWKIKDPDFIQELIIRSSQIKISVVEKDTLEGGYRRVLNFGHTIAHAIEHCEEYKIPHGQAVYIGILVEAYISMKIAGFPKESLEKICSLIKEYEFPLEISKKVTKQKMIQSMTLDKKSKSSIPRFVLLKTLGKVHSFDGEYCSAIDSSLLEEALDWMFTMVRIL